MAAVLSESASCSSTREFLAYEASCGATTATLDTDEELKAIFTELNKLSGEPGAEKVDVDDVDLILKKARDLVIESREKEVLGNLPASAKRSNGYMKPAQKVPQIKITKANDHNIPKKSDINTAKLDCKDNVTIKPAPRDISKEATRKSSVRPFSAGVIDLKQKEAVKHYKITPNNSPKKSFILRQEQLLEELKDTNERVKSLELHNVELTEDNKVFRSKLQEISEQKHVLELKLVECDKFVGRLGKEYENRKLETETMRANESKLIEELTKERNERKNISLQLDKDKMTIQDLQRQCKEMELILRRKHPDSVSALIVASKSSTIDENKRKLLEERIMRLESELTDKESNFQSILMTLQEKFGDMKQKYESHIIDVERQLMDDRKINTELKKRISKANQLDACSQTDPKGLIQTVATQTFLKSTERLSSAASRLSQNSTIIFNKLREDTYLIATIKGLQAELTAKQRMISKINRETEELRKNLRNMQKEKEVIHNLNPQKRLVTKQTKSMDNLQARALSELESELVELRRQRDGLLSERDGLLQSLKRTNEEFIMLKKKRIQDLHTLQLSHEQELMQMNMQIYPMQEEIQVLNCTVEALQARTRTAGDQPLKVKLNGVEDAKAGGDGASMRRENVRRLDAF